MLLPHLCLPAFGFLLAATCSPAPAQAQDQGYRPDAEGFPCAAPKLAVVQDGPGFAIRKADPSLHEAELHAAAAVVNAGIAIGAAIKMDRAILAASARQPKEAIDAGR